MGKTLRITLGLIVMAELLSWLGQSFELLQTIVYFLILLTALILTLTKIDYGFYFLLTEIFIGGFGYLFTFQGISIRIGIFAIFVLASLIKIISQNRLELKIFVKKIETIKIFFIFALIFFSAGLLGLINNGLKNTFFDANAWLYFLILPILCFLLNNKKAIQNILAILIASTLWLSLKTIFLLYIFSHGLAQIGDLTYRWVRSTGVGEITYMSDSMFRIFLQSQIFCLMAFLFFSAIWLKGWRPKSFIEKIFFAIYSYLILLCLLISQSRSFWLGGLTALLAIVIILIWQKSINYKKLVLFFVVLCLTIFSQLAFTRILTGAIFNNRLNNLASEPAGASRLNELKPLSKAIIQSPIFGYGFGKTLTYQSQDPRILKNNPDGLYTTYAFEWGYFDIWLKLGLIGLSLYLMFILLTINQGINSADYIKFGLAAGLIGLVFVNVFTPYLNHPLGIIYLLITQKIITTNVLPEKS